MKDNSKDIYNLIEDYFSEQESILAAKNLLQAYESQRSTEGTSSVNKLNQEASEGAYQGSTLSIRESVYSDRRRLPWFG